MTTGKTEARHDQAKGLDMMPPADILRLLVTGQQDAAKVVGDALGDIAKAADLVADALRGGGKLVYVGAGSSGLMAMADALELPGTYGIARDRIIMLMAGGLASLSDLAGAPEDDVMLARTDAEIVSAGDCVVCVSASGSTPYVVAVAAIARERGATLVSMANNAGARLFADADVAILLQTPAEIVAGSTRMGAGTAQKIAFNMLSTLAAIKLGHVHDGHMVNLKADNDKLRLRAARIVADITGIDAQEAGRLVAAASGSVKTAILLAAGAGDLATAKTLLAGCNDNVRRALEMIRSR